MRAMPLARLGYVEYADSSTPIMVQTLEPIRANDSALAARKVAESAEGTMPFISVAVNAGSNGRPTGNAGARSSIVLVTSSGYVIVVSGFSILALCPSSNPCLSFSED